MKQGLSRIKYEYQDNRMMWSYNADGALRKIALFAGKNVSADNLQILDILYTEIE